MNATSKPFEAPLTGIRILEIAPASAGAVARLFAELGADVIKLAQPDTGTEVPLPFSTNDTNKRVIELPAGSAQAIAAASRLALGADILIDARLDTSVPSLLDDDAISRVRAENPQIVILSLTPFGKDNAYSHWKFSSSVMDALVGNVARSGIPDRAPLLPPADITLECAWIQAAWVALLSYFHRLRTGFGDHIDLSIVEAGAQSIDPGFGMGGSALAGKTAIDAPRGRPEGRHLYPLFKCKDGLVRICVLAPRQWQGMFEWMGRPQAYAAPEFNNLHVRFKSPTLLKDVAAFFADKSRAQLESEAANHGVPLAAVLDLEEWVHSEHPQQRGSTSKFTLPSDQTVEVPNGMMEVDGLRAGIRGLPTLVSCDAGWLASERLAPEPESPTPERPLSGLTVLDFGVIVAGAEQSRLMADQGALTLKIENRAFPDGGRQSEAGWIVSPNFAMGHRNKKGLGLNLKQKEGLDLFMALAAKSDIVLANFKPGTLTSLGADYERLSKVNPGIVMGESSAYGSSGPWRGRAGYGPLVRASSGLCAMWSYPDGDISDSMTTYPDHICGRVLAFGAVALLIRRMRKGRGGHIDVAQAETITAQLSSRVAASSLGIDHPARPDAPWGCYDCQGDDEWCVVTVTNTQQWLRLARAIDRPDLADRHDLQTSTGRMANREQLDAAVSDWCSKRSPDEANALLQEAGVPAAKMLRVQEMPDFPFFAARRSFREVSHPHLPHPLLMENSIGFSERVADPLVEPAPIPGEHSIWVARELLGLDQSKIDNLIASGVLEVPAA